MYETDSTYSFRYTLPMIPESSARSFQFSFEAEAASDVRILLASEVDMEDQDPAYEIGELCFWIVVTTIKGW